MSHVKLWETLDSKSVLKDEWIDVRADRVKTPSGLILDPFYKQNPRDWVSVLAVTSEGEVVLNRQYRHGVEKIGLEFPSGNIDQDESDLVAAQRELEEETGYIAKNWKRLLKVPFNPASHSNYVSLFICTDAKKMSTPHQDPAEPIEVTLLNSDDLDELVKSENMNNAFHILLFELWKNESKDSNKRSF